MKALSIKQPWAILIAFGLKDIENRTWRTNFRGKIYIHACGKPINRNEVYEVLDEKQWDFTFDQRNDFNADNIHYSAIIGEVEIKDCVINHPSIWAEKTPIKRHTLEGEPLYAHKPIWNWVLANPVLYDKPILNVKGKLSFWEFQKDSICDTCTAGMCEICSERHTSSKYQLNKEMASDYYASQIDEIIEKKEAEERKLQRGDIIDYQYACGSSADVVKAEVTWVDSQGFYVKYNHPTKGETEEKAKVW
jgi:hypothetical protein